MSKQTSSTTTARAKREKFYWNDLAKTEDDDQTAAKVVELVGGIYTPTVKIPNIERFALFNDFTSATHSISTLK